MKVMKFGGTSIGTPEGLKIVKDIIESEKEPVIVVVSALAGVTDRLLLAADFAVKSNAGYKTILEEVILMHEDIIEKTIASRQEKEEIKQKYRSYTMICETFYVAYSSSAICRKKLPIKS